MEVKFFAAKYVKPIVLPKAFIELLPHTVCLFTTIQFYEQVPKIVEQLEKAHKKVLLLESKNYYYDGKKTKAGQLLGCNQEEIKDVEAFVYIGDGLFHPKILMVKNTQPIFGYDPIEDTYQKLEHEDMELLKKKRKAALSAFLMSMHVGVLISTKPGQNLLNKALSLKSKFPDKTFYFIAFNDINFGELENFPFVQCWVNTACYRIGLDDTNKMQKPVVNMNDLAGYKV
jgi:2-(3-amino-3-carboxypropyl)histidine synthase